MKKFIAATLMAVSMLLPCQQVMAEESAPMVFEQVGINIDFEDVIDDYENLAELSSSGIISHDPLIALLLLDSYALPKETVYELDGMIPNVSEEAQEKIMKVARDSYRELAYVFVTDAEDPETAVKSVIGELPEGAEIIEVGEAEACHYLELRLPLDKPEVNYDDLAEFGFDTEALRLAEESSLEDMKNFRTAFEERLGKAKLYAPIDPDAGIIGRTISFETTDLDGNTVTSDDLFKNNEITMVNLWGTWCPNCVNEMEELARIHTRLQEKGCGVVGIEWERQPIETMKDEVLAFLEEKGVNYPSVIMPEDNEIFNQVTGYPTTFFVDSTGKILTFPIAGARVGEYERTVEKLLGGEEVEAETDSAKEPNEGSGYRVIVCDPDGNPVEGAVIQFCDDVTCSFQTTGADGITVFEAEQQKAYEVHVLQAPEGFKPDETVYNTPDTYSDVKIILEKAE